jgi:ferrous iron transport protein B
VSRSQPLRVALIGNPNTGKTCIFNHLTHNKAKTGNWSGVTLKQLRDKIKGVEVDIIDLPGVYSLDPNAEAEGKVTHDFIYSGDYDFVINVVDASKIERDLYLTMQLKDLGLPLLVVLNMSDVAERHNTVINTDLLEQELGCKVLKASVKRELGLTGIIADIPQHSVVEHHKLPKLDASLEANCRRYERVDTVVKKTIKRDESIARISDRIDRIVLNKYLSVPFFFLIIYLLFSGSMILGGVFQDFFEISATVFFVDLPARVLEPLLPAWLVNIISQGLGNGITTVISFVPVIFSLYLLLTFLEESGYMARAAFVADQITRKIGLSGRAFIPLLIGFGCNVSSVLAARTIPDQEDRIVTSVMSPFMSCTARLAVYVVLCTAFFAQSAHLVVFALYAIGVTFALVTGFVVKRVLFAGTKHRPMILEIPQYQMPEFKRIVRRAHVRTMSFVTGAGKMVIQLFLILQIAMSIPTGGDDNLMTYIGKRTTAVFAPMGVDESNWPASVALLSGMFAKEAVIGSFNALYIGDQGDSERSVGEGLMEAFASIPNNFYGVVSEYRQLFHLQDYDLQKNFIAADSVDRSLFRQMRAAFPDRVGVFAYMVFVLLYFPCLSVFGTLQKELGAKWAWFSMIWSTVLAYTVATTFYQLYLLWSFGAAPYPFAPVAGLLLLTLILAIMRRSLHVERQGGKVLTGQ